MNALPPIDVSGRETRVVDELEAREIDALIVTSPTNIRWLTGFAGSNATVVAVGDEFTLFTDSRYADRAPSELQGVGSSASVVIERAKLGAAINGLVGKAGRVGLEADHVTWGQQRVMASEWLPDHALLPTEGVIDSLRSRKDGAEIARISAAAHVVDSVLAEVRSVLLETPTEREFARAIEAGIRAGGADDIGFDAIVASGPNGAIPHHSPGARQIGAGDLVIVDVGAMVDGYRSDMTRTFCVGECTEAQRRHYDVVIEAQQAGVDAMVAGAGTAEVDAAARAVIESAGWGESFTHGTGHGIGLDIHELPRVAKGVDDVYELGTVATVEPGVYLRGAAGVRIEDTCVVTADGAKRLTKFVMDPVVA